MPACRNGSNFVVMSQKILEMRETRKTITSLLLIAGLIPCVARQYQPRTSGGQALCYYEPLSATQSDRITVFFNAAAGNAALKGYGGDVYVHAGVLTDGSSSTSDWKYASRWGDNSEKFKLRRSADNPDLYELTMVPREFFGIQGGDMIRSLAFVFRDADGALQGKAAGERDIIVPFVSQPAPAKGNVGAFTGFSDDGTTVTVRGTDGTLLITPYSEYVVKVTTRAAGDDTAERRTIIVSAAPDAAYTVEETPSSLIVKTAATEVEVDKSTCAVSFLDSSGRTVLSENEGMDNHSVPRTCSFKGMNEAAFYGGGYNGQHVNLEGRKIVMDNTQTGGWDNTWSAPHNICVPFYVSSAGYGVLFDDLYRGATVSLSATGVTYSSDSPTPVAYYYVGGDGTMASVMENYTWLTGRQELPPYWSLGYMTSRYGYRSSSETEEAVRRLREVCRLPLDAIVFDLYWQGSDNSGMGNLDWYAPNWADPAGMMSKFKNMGVRTVCITEPFFTSKSANYSALSASGYFADGDVSGMEWLGSERVGLLDATNPAALDWMWAFYKARTEEGVSGWWLDLGEPERHDDDSRHVGGTVGQVHNEFGNLWLERVYRGLTTDFPDERPFLMPRSGTAGMQRYSVFPWSGDIRRSWGGLQAQIPALVSSGMSGVGYMGSDVGGFSADGVMPDLYLRWVEFSVFSPMMRTHGTLKPEPYNEEYADVLPAVRDYVNMRYRYLPYTYTLAYENAAKGLPLARPVNFYDAEAGLPDCNDAYLWGKDLFVAPVVDSGSSRDITFPAGNWVDMSDFSATYAGGMTVSYDAPLEKLPYFGRKGSFITTFSQVEFTNTESIDRSALTVTYLMDDGQPEVTGFVYDDDGKSPDALAGSDYLLMRFSGKREDGTDRIVYSSEGNGYEGMPETRTFMFVIPNYGKEVRGVRLEADGQPSVALAAAQSLAQLESDGTVGYFYDADKTLYVKAAMSRRGEICVDNGSSGVDAVRGDGRLSLWYSSAARRFLFTLPAGCESAYISVFSPDGALWASIPCGMSEGVNTVDCGSLERGVYLARLTVEAPGGVLACSKTVKLIVS